MGRVLVAIVGIALCAACGSPGDQHDAGTAAPDVSDVDGSLDLDASQLCSTSLTFGTFDFRFENPTTGSMGWTAQVVGTFPDAETLFTYFEFLGGAPIGPGTVSLGVGANANYDTCTSCILLFSSKYYFPRAGTLTLSEDVIGSRRLHGSITGLVMEEVTFDQSTSHSTPVLAGACATMTTAAVDEDRVPNAWTCGVANWGSGGACNCLCGGADPDCTINGAVVTGCVSGMACFVDACVTPPTNQTCASAATLTLGAVEYGTTVGATRDYNAGTATCTGSPNHSGPDVVYQVTLTAGTSYTITLTGVDPRFDPSIAVVGPGTPTVCDSAPITACVAGTDIGYDGENETVMYTPSTTGTYFVIVDGIGVDEAGAFYIRVF